MMMQVAHGFFELRVGPYKLGLPTRAVLGVLDNVSAAESHITFRERQVRLFDLHALIEPAATSDTLPFVFVVDTGHGWLAVAADAVGIMPIVVATPVVPVPSLGLLHPKIFRGALRWQGRLVLALDLDGLAAFVA